MSRIRDARQPHRERVDEHDLTAAREMYGPESLKKVKYAMLDRE